MAGVSKQRRLTDAERDKAATCTRLVYCLANEVVNRDRLFGDLAEAVYDKAVDGLLNAAVKHDERRGSPMHTLAAYAIRGYIGHALQSAERRAGREPARVAVNFDTLYPDRGRRHNGRAY